MFCGLFDCTVTLFLIDGDYKLVSTNAGRDAEWELYDLKNDPGETKDLAGDLPGRFEKMKSEAEAVISSIDASAMGKDYPEGEVLQSPRRAFWYEIEAYQAHLETFFKRPEYEGYRQRAMKAGKGKTSKKRSAL